MIGLLGIVVLSAFAQTRLRQLDAGSNTTIRGGHGSQRSSTIEVLQWTSTQKSALFDAFNYILSRTNNVSFDSPRNRELGVSQWLDKANMNIVPLEFTRSEKASADSNGFLRELKGLDGRLVVAFLVEMLSPELTKGGECLPALIEIGLAVGVSLSEIDAVLDDVRMDLGS